MPFSPISSSSVSRTCCSRSTEQAHHPNHSHHHHRHHRHSHPHHQHQDGESNVGDYRSAEHLNPIRLAIRHQHRDRVNSHEEEDGEFLQLEHGWDRNRKNRKNRTRRIPLRRRRHRRAPTARENRR
ncbi:hypothetical protein V8G54_023316 [Vigna mungo]|uniref:Uncharacterized protein n=1 Tax=Vigna mungo TaxID=3915 RepID=A0AAQ3N4I8_VIGMU